MSDDATGAPRPADAAGEDNTRADDATSGDDRAAEAALEQAAEANPGLDAGGPLAVPPRPPQTPEDDQLALRIEDAMYDVVDPEIGINVVDLGLVYDIWVEDGGTAVIHMTLTTPACPLTDMLTAQAESLVLDVDGVDDLRINWVWSPPWSPQMITEDGRDQMRALGFSV